MLNKPSMLLINKMDTENAQQKYAEIKDLLKNLPGNLELLKNPTPFK